MRKGKNYQGVQGNFWGNGYVPYLALGDGFTGVLKHIKLYVLNVGSLLQVNYPLIKLWREGKTSRHL